jgi:response regulator RpfG family c-di-GMP phosphodiesterase
VFQTCRLHRNVDDLGSPDSFLEDEGEPMSSPRRVLIIEDHDDSCEILTALLQRAGFSVTAYDRCKPAERHLGACDMDIALLNVRLPERCGDDFGRELRAVRRR